MVKNKDRWSALSMKDRADLIKLYISNGVTSLNDIKKDYNSFAPGGPIETDEYGYPADITPAIVEADYPRESEVWKRADASNADLIQRLKQGSSRATIPDWEDNRKVATHKMMSAGNYAVGNVQNINGQLIDFTDPKYGFKNPSRAAIDSAIERGDYVEFDTEGDARYFAEHYKKHYNSFGDGGDTEGDNNDSTTPERKLTLEEFLQAKADSTRVAAHAKSLSRDEGVEIIYPLSEGRKEANQQFVDQYYDLNPEFIGPTLPSHLGIKPSYDQAVKELNNNCEYGLNCIGTATDNYPEDSREVSNESFRGNYEEKGFYIVPFEEKLPGDIVQQGGHSVIFDSYKRDPHPTLPQAFGDAYPVYNYSNGSIGTEAYRKQKRYPFTEPVVYRYVGTPALIQQWTEEYNAQNKKLGGKINRFDDGGPTREMTPSEAAALNKTLNNSQYMLAVGDSPDDPAYLSTDYLEPAVVKAFNSEEEYNRYQGEKFGEYVSNEISEAGTKFAPILVGTAAAPWLISGGIAAYTNPLIRTGLDVLGSVDSVRNMFSDNGVSKTFRLAREGNTWGAIKSGIGDIFDFTSVGDLYSGGKAAFNYLGELAQYSNAKWLDMPVPLFNTALDLSFPKKERDRVFREAHFYNERQKSRIGIPQNSVPLKNTVNYKVPSIRQQVLNSLGKTTSVTGVHTAGAQHSGNDVTFFLEGFRPFSKTFAPRHVAAHEIRHDIQKGFNAHSLPKESYGMFETPVTTQQRIFDFATKGHINSLSPENQFLFNAIYGSENPALESVARKLYDSSAGTNWHKSLSEFDAELAYYREMYGYNVSWDILPQSVKAKIKTGMADRFSISEELVDEIATTLANHGYSNGGKLLTKNRK